MPSSNEAQLSSIEARRKAVQKWEAAGVAALGRSPEGLCESWINIALPDGWVSRTRLIWPVPAPGTSVSCPLIVYFHGGGFFLGSPDQVLLPARSYALHFGAVVACPTYKLAPENPFPGPIHSAWDTCVWLSSPQNLNDGPLKETGARVQPQLGFVVGGLSAGALFTTVIGGIQAASQGRSQLMEGRAPLQHPVTGLFAAIPGTLHEDMIPERYQSIFTSRDENAYGEGLSTADIREIEHLHQADHRSPWYSAINLDSLGRGNFKGHPGKVFVQACGLDPLRDDAIIYERWLREMDVAETKLSTIEDMAHGGWVSQYWKGTRRPDFRESALDGMGWLLGRDWDKNRSGRY